MEKLSGIVLKTHFPQKKTITILESHAGLMQYVSPTHDLCVGTMISYVTVQKSTMPIITSLEKIGLPLGLARADLLFFHHVLELCYYFVPTASHMPEVFLLLKTLYISDFYYEKKLHKKIFLIRLFILFGIVPETEELSQLYRSDLACPPVDTIREEAIILDNKGILDAWLLRCIQLHPSYEYFKTRHYLAFNGDQ